MMKLDGIIAFVAVAETESISAAARQLQLSKSVISERLTELERNLGAELVQRTTRKLSLTEDGKIFYDRASRIVREIDDSAAEISERRGTLSGPFRIAGPVSFGSLHLGPALYPFLIQNPGIELTLELDDRFVDAAADGYDAVIRHGAIVDPRLVVKHLASSRRVLVAAPDYLQRCGSPRSLDELERHRAIIYTNRGASDWRFHSAAKMISVRAPSALRVNNGIVMRDAAIAGVGIALLPTFMISAALTTGQLRVVDVGAEAEGAVIHIAYPKVRRASAKVDALAECLRRAFGDPPIWEANIPTFNNGGERHPSRATANSCSTSSTLASAVAISSKD